MKPNSMSFIPKEVEQGLLNKLIDYFLLYNKTSNDHYIDFHVTTDGYCMIVEWVDLPYSHEWGGSFQYVDEEEQVIHEIHLPDGTYMRSSADWEDKEIIEEFLKNNPNYEYDPFAKEWHMKKVDKPTE